MDNRTFDALTRRFGAQRNRRDAVKAFTAGLLGLGIGKGAAAQVSVERQNCGQPCSGDGDCNAGLLCRESRDDDVCVRRPDGGGSCSRNEQCSNNLDLCRNGRCENQSNCNRCSAAADCPSGDACRNGNCGECNRDRDCRSNERCRNGRCKRGGGGGGGNDCNRNSDCPRKKRCRNGRCVNRN